MRELLLTRAHVFVEAIRDAEQLDARPRLRLSTERLEHSPSYVNFPGENSELRYGESIFAGYRHYDATDREPRFCFGHGLGYSSFSLARPRLSATTLAPGESVSLEVDLTNTGERRAAEVVQCYVGSPDARLARPPRELKAFEKHWLDPGESVTVTLELDSRAFAYWDPGDPDFEAMNEGVPVPAGGGADRRTEPGWAIDSGRYIVHVGTSSRDLPHRLELEIK